jgi:hypothetical protein
MLHRLICTDGAATKLWSCVVFCVRRKQMEDQHLSQSGTNSRTHDMDQMSARNADLGINRAMHAAVQGPRIWKKSLCSALLASWLAIAQESVKSAIGRLVTRKCARLPRSSKRRLQKLPHFWTCLRSNTNETIINAYILLLCK